MAQLPLDQAIPRFQQNDDRLNTFVNGDQNTDMTTSGGQQVPSVRKIVATKTAEIDTQVATFISDKDAEINLAANSILAQSESARDTALGARDTAIEARDKATEWAEGEGEVEPGKRSAKYWAEQAADNTIPPGAIGTTELSNDPAEQASMLAKIGGVAPSDIDPQKPHLIDQMSLTNSAAFATWLLADGTRHGFFTQHYDPGNGGYDQESYIHEIADDGQIGDLVQTIATRGAYCGTPFLIGTDRYLFVSNYAKTAGGFSYSTNSELYRWNSSTGQYDLLQTMGLEGAVRAQHTQIGTDHYLAIASSVTGANNFSRYLYIYKFNSGTGVFDQLQAMSTQGCYSGKVFQRGADIIAAACEYSNGNSYGQIRANQLWRWNGSSFVAWKSFEGKGCSDVAAFELNGETYLAYINQFDGVTNTLGSPIFRVESTGLVPLCSVTTSFGIRVRAFNVNGKLILAYCSAARGDTARTYYDESRVDLYIFDGSNAQLWLSIPAKGAYDAEIWSNDEGEYFIGIANSIGGTAVAYDTNQETTILKLPSVPIGSGVNADGHLYPSAFGQCRLVRVSETQVRLERYNGRLVTVAGRPVEIPSEGILRDNAGLAASGTYYVYLFAHSDVPALLISSRPPFPNPSSGFRVKDDDLRYTLVGRVTTDTNAQFPAAANVVSWFNSLLPF